MTLRKAISILLPVMGLMSLGPVSGQQVDVTAGPLHGQAIAGASDMRRSSTPCPSRGIIARSAGGASSASVSVSSSNGTTAVGGAASPGGTVQELGCNKAVKKKAAVASKRRKP
ncbi:MAG: hypothetical protein JO256_01440 [Alphaproteobacteria bacterium]|nr:hypothetical protein [Alphaproteobacteria bacterium]